MFTPTDRQRTQHKAVFRFYVFVFLENTRKVKHFQKQQFQKAKKKLLLFLFSVFLFLQLLFMYAIFKLYCIIILSLQNKKETKINTKT